LATTAEAAVDLPDRARLALVAVPLVLGGLLLAEALAFPAAWLPLDEAAVVGRARGAAGGLSGPLLPFLLSPFGHAAGGTLLDAGRALGVVCWAALFVPTYFLARRGASSLVAGVAGALAVSVPAAVYSGALVPEALGTLLAACALWLAVRASERNATPDLAAALALGIAAAVARPWFAAVPVAVLAGYVLPRVRRPTPFEVALAVGAAYGLYYGLGTASPELAHAVAHPWAVLRSALGSVGAATLGFGALPAVLAAARIREGAEGRMLAVAAPALAVAAGLSGVGRVDERPLLALAPLVFALAARGPAPRRALLVAAGALAATVLFVAWPGSSPALEQAPGLAFVRGLFGATGAGPLLAALLVVVAAALALSDGRWQRLAILGVLLAMIPGGEIVAWTQARKESRNLAAALPHPRDWVDRAVGGGTHVDILRAGPASPDADAELRIWNRSLRDEIVVDPGAADEHTGALPTSAAPHVVLALGLEPAGRALGGGVYQTALPLRVASSTEGVYADGWSGADATYRRFAGAGGTRALVTVSRRSWGGKDVPGDVTIVAAPLGGATTARRTLVIHSGQVRQVEIPVPAAPFELDVHIDPTFSPAKLGAGGDTRELGAQLTFAYPA
jgi:hypothetical protein